MRRLRGVRPDPPVGRRQSPHGGDGRLDGRGPSKDFPNYVVDSGQRARMGVPGNATPALVLFDTVTRRTVPIGFGILSADDISERIFALTNTKVGSDY